MTERNIFETVLVRASAAGPPAASDLAGTALKRSGREKSSFAIVSFQNSESSHSRLIGASLGFKMRSLPLFRIAGPGILELAAGLAVQPAVAMREQKNFHSAPKQNARAQAAGYCAGEMRLRGIDRMGGNLRTRWRSGFAAAVLTLALCGPQGSPPAEARDFLSGLFDLPFGDEGGRSYRGYNAPQGPDTVAIQTALTELGYNTGEADGQSGQKTRDAILLWQRDNGREPTGTLTPDQAAELMTGQAIRRYDAAIENEPRNSEARVGRGAALILRGDIDKARKDFQDAAEANPDNADAYYGQGFLYAAAGEAIDALELYRKAVELLKQRQQQQREQQQQQQMEQLRQRHQQEQAAAGAAAATAVAIHAATGATAGATAAGTATAAIAEATGAGVGGTAAAAATAEAPGSASRLLCGPL